MDEGTYNPAVFFSGFFALQVGPMSAVRCAMALPFAFPRFAISVESAHLEEDPQLSEWNFIQSPPPASTIKNEKQGPRK